MIDKNALLANFVEESQQHLQMIEPDLLDLEKGGEDADAEVLNRILRSVHSIKGSSGFFGLRKIGELSHVLESLLSLLRDKKISVSRELTNALFEGIDMLRAMVDDVVGSENFDIQTELNVLRELLDRTKGEKQESGVRKVTVTEKTAGPPAAEKPRTLELSEEDFNRFVSRGRYLYSVKLSLNEDLRDKGKTPHSYINEKELLGTFVNSFLDTSGVNGLEDCLHKDLSFNFLFATFSNRT